MAEFDTEIKTPEPGSYLNYSRGVEVNTQGDSTIGKLFSGVGDILTLATKTGNQFFENRIKNDVYDSVDAIRNEYGVGAAATISGTDALDRTTPEQITRAGRTLDSLKQAAEQGKLQESHYQARLESVARQLRARYPGHREEVDAMISQVAGGNPANKLRSALMSEYNEAAGKNKSDTDKWDTWVRTAINDGRINGDEANLYFAGKLTNQHIVKLVADREHYQKQIQLETARLGLKAAQGNDIDRDVTRAYVNLADGIINQGMNSKLTAMTPGNRSLNETINEINTRGVTPQLVEQATSLFNRERQMALEQLNREHQGILNDPRYREVKFPPGAYEAAVKRVNEHYDQVGKAIADKDFGYFSTWKRNADAIQESTKVAALKNDFIAREAALRSLLGDQAVQLTKVDGSPALKASMATLTEFYLRGVATGQNKTIRDTLSGLSRDSENAEEFKTNAKELVSRGQKILSDPKAPPQMVDRFVKFLYSPDGVAMWNSLAPSAKEESFKQFSNPAISKRMIELKNQGNQEAWSTYKNWVEGNVAVYSARPLADLTNHDENKYYSIKFDTERNAFINASKGATPASVQDEIAANGEAKQTALVARSLNTYFSSVIDVYKAEGVKDIYGRLRTWTAASGVDLDKYATVVPKGNEPATGQDRKLKVAPSDGSRLTESEAQIVDMLRNSNVRIGSRESTNIEDRRGLPPQFTPVEPDRNVEVVNYDPNGPLPVSDSFITYNGRTISDAALKKLRDTFGPDFLEEMFDPPKR